MKKFHECHSKKMKKDLSPYELINTLSSMDYEDIHSECLGHLPEPSDSCEFGYSQPFASLPHGVLKHRKQTDILEDKRYQEDYHLAVRNSHDLAKSHEEEVCPEGVSETTKSLQKATRKVDLDVKLPDLSGLWVSDSKDGLYAILGKTLNFLLIILAMYVIGNFLLKLTSRSATSGDHK